MATYTYTNNYYNYTFAYETTVLTQLELTIVDFKLESGDVVPIAIVGVPINISPRAKTCEVTKSTLRVVVVYSNSELTPHHIDKLSSIYGYSTIKMPELDCTQYITNEYPTENFYTGSFDTLSEVPVEYRYFTKRTTKALIHYNETNGAVTSFVPSKTKLIIIMPSNFVLETLFRGYFVYGNFIITIHSEYPMSGNPPTMTDMTLFSKFESSSYETTRSIESILHSMGFLDIVVYPSSVVGKDEWMTAIIGNN